MKQREGFVSNSSSTSFVLERRHMTDEEEGEFIDQMEVAEMYDQIGSTRTHFFGVIDHGGKFYKWLDEKNFNEIEWG